MGIIFEFHIVQNAENLPDKRFVRCVHMADVQTFCVQLFSGNRNKGIDFGRE